MRSVAQVHKRSQWLQGGLVLFAIGVLFALFSTPIAGQSPQLSYWKLEEAAGPLYGDDTGGSDASCVGDCPAAAAGQVGGGQRFNGSSTGLETASNAALNWAAGNSFSVELWMQGTVGQTCADSAETMIGRADPSTGMRWSLGCASASGNATFHLFDESGNGLALEGSAIHNGGWHHIVGVRDGVNNRNLLYVNGQEVASAPITYAAGFAAATGVDIGWLNVDAASHFEGVLDEVALYPRVLTPTEIGSHYYLSRGYTELCAAPVRIMPLGDSITQGASSGVTDLDKQIAYRRNLWQSLRAAGYDPDFVGSLTHGQYYQSVDGFDPNHEGHPSWTDSRIGNNIYTFLGNTPADVILLHIGTNSLNVDPADVEHILNEIDRYDDAITVVLARIINRTTYSQTTTDFNNNITAMAQARIANGDKILIADMENGAGIDYAQYPPGDMWDNLHPYATGYTKMAQVWFNALSTLLPTCSEGSPVITSAPVTAATAGQPYSYDVEASGNPAPSFALTVAPTGMTIDAASGLIAWTPNTTGTVDVTVEASNSVGVISQSYTITVGDGWQTPVITSAPVAEGWVGAGYSYDVEATGNPSPTYGLVTAPMGMTIDAASGLIAWTPNTAGVFDVTVEAANSTGTDSQSFSVTVQDERQGSMCPAELLSYWPMDDAAGSTLFSDIQSGYDGSCSGTSCPTATTGRVAGAFSFDGNDKVDVPYQSNFDWGNTDSFSIALWINTNQSCSGNKVFLGKYGQGGSSVAWWAGCNANNNANFYLRDSGKRSLNFSGTTPINDGNWHHLVAVYDGSGRQSLLYVNGQLEASKATSFNGNFITNAPLNLGYYINSYYFNGIMDEVAIYNRALSASEIAQQYVDGTAGQGYCTVGETVDPPVISSAPVTAGTTGQPYSYDVEASGNPAPSFALPVAPSGMTIDAATGVIAWMPDTAGVFDVTVEATNSAGTDSQNFTITVSDAPQAPLISSAPVTAGTTGQPYSYDVEASGNPAPSFALPVAPSGMTIDATTGVIAWTPDTPGVFDVTVEATNSAGTDSQSFTITVSDAPQAPLISSAPVTAGTTGQPYSYDVEASGNPAPSFALPVAPTGMTIDAATGVIAWMPDTAGVFDVTVEATNSAGTDSQNFTITVEAEATEAPTFTTSPVIATVGQLYQYQAQASGNPAPVYSLAIAPLGMTIDAVTGLLAWTPNMVGLFAVTIEASNSAGTVSQSFIISASDTPQAPLITSAPVTAATTGEPYSYDVEASGNPMPSFALTVAPSGMTIDATTGVIAWTPDTAGTFDVTVEAINSAGTDSQSFTITVETEVAEAPSFFTSPVVAVVGQLYQYQAHANGAPTPLYALTAAPTGMSIDPTTGIAAWTPDTLGLAEVAIVAENSVGTIAQSFQIQVVASPTALSRRAASERYIAGPPPETPLATDWIWMPMISNK